jgi:hypothetical protein
VATSWKISLQGKFQQATQILTSPAGDSKNKSGSAVLMAVVENRWKACDGRAGTKAASLLELD